MPLISEEKIGSRLCRLLGSVHRSFGVSNQRVFRRAVIGIDGNTDACRDAHLLAVDVAGRANRIFDAPCSGADFGKIRNSIENDEKPVAFGLGDSVRLPHTRPEPFGYLLQDSISTRVAHCVIDDFEPIEINVQKRNSLASSPRRSQSVREAIAQQSQIRQMSESIVIGEKLDLLLGSLPFRDLTKVPDPPQFRPSLSINGAE